MRLRCGSHTVPATQRIVLVDDESDVLAAVKRLLQKSFPLSEVLAVGSAKAALEIVDHQTIDLVISDYRMPEMDGVEFLRQCQERQPHASRLLITAFPEHAAGPGSAKVPILSKPLDLKTFVGMVQAVLAGRPRPN